MLSSGHVVVNKMHTFPAFTELLFCGGQKCKQSMTVSECCHRSWGYNGSSWLQVQIWVNDSFFWRKCYLSWNLKDDEMSPGRGTFRAERLPLESLRNERISPPSLQWGWEISLRSYIFRVFHKLSTLYACKCYCSMLSAEIWVQCPLLDRINFMDTEAMAVRCWTQAVELVSPSF